MVVRLYVRVLLMLLVIPSFCRAQPAREQPLKSLHPGHPRLFVRDDEVACLRDVIKSDARMKRWAEAVRADAERMLGAKPVEHKLVGPRLLAQSRLALQRISTLAGMYLIDRDERFAERAKREMLVVAGFPDWNPSHFLDTAEMTCAMGIGYDWLYEYLDADERKEIREAIVRMGLKPGLDALKQKKAPPAWTTAPHNWGQVCNGGLTVGALAVGDEERTLVTELLLLCREAIKPSLKAYEPDGGFAEGPAYWNYATAYMAYYVAAIESALGHDWRLKETPGLEQTGYFRVHSVGPTNKTFNFADATEAAAPAPHMFWLGRTYDDVTLTLHEQALIGDDATIFHLLWWRDPGVKWERIRIPLDTFFRGVNVAFFRSALRDSNALYVGFKAGDNKANHAHLDLGSFVLDARGMRWAADLGRDNYNLPGYFGKERWNYYRLRTESHNTLTLDGENQDPGAEATIVTYVTRQERAHGIMDLTAAYGKKAKRVRRGLAMIERGHVLVQDEIETSEPVSVRWNFMTPAAVAIEGYQATLTQGDEKLRLRILSPKGAAFKVVDAKAPPPQGRQPEVSNLTVQLPNKVSKATIVVLISPGDAEPTERPVVEPLERWATR